MTFLQVIRIVEDAALRQRTVQKIVRQDIFRLNHQKDGRYGVFSWVQGEHSVSGGLVTWNLTLYYVDRLTDGRGNDAEVQSVAFETLNNILAGVAARGVEVEAWTLQPFTERFADECAGAYARVRLVTPVSAFCEDYFEELGIVTIDNWTIVKDNNYVTKDNENGDQV